MVRGRIIRLPPGVAENVVLSKTTSNVADKFSVRVAASWSRLNDAALYSHKTHIYNK